MNQENRAFTLIELLIVVAIIAILAAIAVPNFLEAQVRSKVSRAKNDMRAIATGLEAYVVDHNHYPPSALPNAAGAYQWIDPWMARLKWVTTPVAFMSSITKDTFYPPRTRGNANPSADGIARFYATTKGYDVYQYAEDYYAWNLYMGNPGSLGFDPKGLTDNNGVDVTYVLISYAPDRIYNFMMPDMVDKLKLEYDPTNGTMSDGDIMRFGGPGGTGIGR